MRIKIDNDRCTGHGRCYALAPEVFEPDDEGHSIVLREEGHALCREIAPEVFDLGDQDYLHVLSDEVTPENEQQIKESVRQCPRQAISIVD